MGVPRKEWDAMKKTKKEAGGNTKPAGESEFSVNTGYGGKGAEVNLSRTGTAYGPDEGRRERVSFSDQEEG